MLLSLKMHHRTILPHRMQMNISFVPSPYSFLGLQWALEVSSEPAQKLHQKRPPSLTLSHPHPTGSIPQFVCWWKKKPIMVFQVSRSIQVLCVLFLLILNKKWVKCWGDQNKPSWASISCADSNNHFLISLNCLLFLFEKNFYWRSVDLQCWLFSVG